MLNISGLKILDVDHVVLTSSIDLMKRYHVNLRDSIHAASAIDVSAQFFVSEDPDFDSLTEIKRIPILSV